MLRQAQCVKLFESKAAGSIEAHAGESILVRRVETYQFTGDANMILKVDRVTSGMYRVRGKSGNHIATLIRSGLKFNLMEFLESKGINVAIPVAEGQVFSFTTTATVDVVIVIFDRYDAGDIKKTDPNGTEAKAYTFVQYMNINTGRATDGDALFDTADSPSEFPDFPCGKVVPANHRISILGFIGCPWRDGQADSKGLYTTHIKLVRNREVLFDEDRGGIPFKAYMITGTSLLYAARETLIGAGVRDLGSTTGAPGDPLIFDPPLVFVAGEELNVSAVVKAYGSSPVWTPLVADLAAILKVERI